MADESDTVSMKPGVTVTRAAGKPPVRKDARSLMEMLRDEFNTHLGTAPKHNGQTVDEAVDDAVSGVPGKPSADY